MSKKHLLEWFYAMALLGLAKQSFWWNLPSLSLRQKTSIRPLPCLSTNRSVDELAVQLQRALLEVSTGYVVYHVLLELKMLDEDEFAEDLALMHLASTVRSQWVEEYRTTFDCIRDSRVTEGSLPLPLGRRMLQKGRLEEAGNGDPGPDPQTFANFRKKFLRRQVKELREATLRRAAAVCATLAVAVSPKVSAVRMGWPLLVMSVNFAQSSRDLANTLISAHSLK
ncbi:uncharacterized protein Z518_01593 [Rhinocladiella mackenziei CBS 650.93]|uniref:Uncharacterized protein n=1 Tax=Rhinocladiella mackenziei CBS 650.93 TaxID=1442369 RepID=A0A0D2JM51_9EURO|nr:uncharacterized protein Z518_01593 [Rhinocladiella mackenziei CBS 650.93]KIX10510.1 hypothetical protein Z518_01593 [Rhinocladiella mackenziei CBS 650.93]